MATAPTPQASSREQSLLAGVSQRVTTKLTSLVELRRRRWHGHNEGSRELHRRLRVGQWEDPPASNQAPSQAAVLFDIAYTTSMMHHADMLTAADSSLTGYATVAKSNNAGLVALSKATKDGVEQVHKTEKESGVKCKSAADGVAAIDENAAKAAEDCATANAGGNN